MFCTLHPPLFFEEQEAMPEDVKPAVRVEMDQSNQPWLTRLLNYAFDQGPVTLILLGILGFIAYSMTTMVPKHIDSIKAGYTEQTTAFDKMQVQQRLDFKEILKDQRDVHTESLKNMATSMDRQTVVLEKLVDKIEKK